MASDFKIKVEKLVGATNWGKCKWLMNMHFERYEMKSIIDRWRKCPSVTENQKASEAWKRNYYRRRRWSRVRWVTWLWIWYWSRLMPRTFGASTAVCIKRTVFNNRVCWWWRIVQAQVRSWWTLLQKPLRLRSYSRSHDIPIKLLYWQILTTVGPEYQELSSVWESLDNNKRKTNSLNKNLRMIEKLLQTSMTAADSSLFAAHASTTGPNRW